jgi:hypothetical protein
MGCGKKWIPLQMAMIGDGSSMTAEFILKSWVSGKPLQWQVGKDKQQELGLQDNPFGSKIETVRG